MPKLKIKSSAKKRFKVTGSGKIIKRGAFHSHLLEKKSKSRKRKAKVATDVHNGELKNVKKELGI
ncbi:MAG: 50S ribosomal protein L35 [Patescibacteria group bacterium]|nr:50S ribosomal protein L35 [Patescibacteria group bacterium]